MSTIRPCNCAHHDAHGRRRAVQLHAAHAAAPRNRSGVAFLGAIAVAVLMWIFIGAAVWL